MRIPFSSLLILPVFCALACTSGGSSDAPVAAKFSSIQGKVFDKSCSAPSCHGSGKKGGLSLTRDSSFSQLVGAAGILDNKHTPPFLRVRPGSPDSSLLFIKITNPDTSEGEIMPKGSDKLSQNKIDAIRQWILEGARDN